MTPIIAGQSGHIAAARRAALDYIALEHHFDVKLSGLPVIVSD
jgi:hypothetical protein